MTAEELLKWMADNHSQLSIEPTLEGGHQIIHLNLAVKKGFKGKVVQVNGYVLYKEVLANPTKLLEAVSNLIWRIEEKQLEQHDHASDYEADHETPDPDFKV